MASRSSSLLIRSLIAIGAVGSVVTLAYFGGRYHRNSIINEEDKKHSAATSTTTASSEHHEGNGEEAVYTSYSDSIENGRTWTNPSNQVAVVTVWSPTSDKVDETFTFYKDVLGLRPITPTAFNVDGTFLVIMEGVLEIKDTKRSRWPLFALQVQDIDTTVTKLREAHVDLPWGIEEDSNSRWIMFYDPSGNLIEIAQFL